MWCSRFQIKNTAKWLIFVNFQTFELWCKVPYRFAIFQICRAMSEGDYLLGQGGEMKTQSTEIPEDIPKDSKLSIPTN